MTKFVTILVFIFLVLLTFNTVNAQGCTEEVTPYGCGHYVHTQVLLRAQPDGNWVINEDESHGFANIGQLVQNSNHLFVEFDDPVNKALVISTQASACMGWRGWTIGNSGGKTGVSIYMGENGTLVDPDEITNDCYLLWVYSLGFVEAT